MEATLDSTHIIRGDPAGFVVVEAERTLLIPDRRGNNRVDTLHNLVADPRIALLFLIPGVNESLRVNGKAVISVAPELLARFEINGKPPRSVVIVNVHRELCLPISVVTESTISGTRPAIRLSGRLFTNSPWTTKWAVR